MAGTSRMNREIHVRNCGGLEVKFLRSTRQMSSDEFKLPFREDEFKNFIRHLLGEAFTEAGKALLKEDTPDPASPSPERKEEKETPSIDSFISSLETRLNDDGNYRSD